MYEALVRPSKYQVRHRRRCLESAAILQILAAAAIIVAEFKIDAYQGYWALASTIEKHLVSS